MSGIVDSISNFISDAIDFVVDAVSAVWNQIVVPYLEFCFSLFGIVDEDVITVQKTSTLMYGTNPVDIIDQTNVKSVMSMVQQGGSFFPWYMKYTSVPKAQLSAFYRFAETGRYIHGLPDMEIHGGDIDYTAVDTALDDAIGTACTRLSLSTHNISDELYYQNLIQASPHFYLPWANTLTHSDQHSVSWDDWTLDSVDFNSGTGDFDLSISRTAAEAVFWIEGPVHIVEGDSATHTIYCNRTVPVGETVTINFAYSGTAPGTDYTEVASVIMASSTSEVDIIITTNENGVSDGSRTIITTIDSITNTNAAFEEVGIGLLNQVTTTITDDEGIILTMGSVVVVESIGIATIPVKLESATTGAFTADYDFTDVTAIGGIDYTDTPGQLNFAGISGEVQNIIVPITTADGDDDGETFEVYFTACSDSAVDIAYVCTVTIDDGTGVTPVVSTVEVYDTISKIAYIPEQTLTVEYYEDINPATEWFYWVYALSDNTYPDADPTTAIIGNMEMFPVAILRSLGVDVNADKETDEYKTTKKLLSTVDLDIDEVIASAALNESYSDVQDMFVNFSISPATEEAIVSKALWLNFYAIIIDNNVTSNIDQYTAAFSEQSINNAVVWSDQTYVEGIEGILPDCSKYYHESISGILYIRRRASETTYDEITISNLSGMAAIVKGGYHAVAWTALGDENFTIPLSHYLVTRMNHIDQMLLFQHAFRLDAYALQVIHLEWYETEAFGDLFKLTMIVLTIVTLGAASGPLAVFEQILLQLLVTEIVMYIAELTGNPALAAIVGVIATMYLGDASGAFDFMSPESVLKASTDFADNLTLVYSEEINQLGEDIRDLNITIEDRMKEQKEALEGAQPDSPITAEFLVALKSVDTGLFPAIDAQYDYKEFFNYDRIVADYHDLNLQVGVI